MWDERGERVEGWPEWDSSRSLPTPEAPPRSPRKNLADFLLESPFAGSELDLERQKDYPRPIDLS
jgi:hypothetical protein